MMTELDGVRFSLRAPFDFSFLHRWGNVFRAFDEQDSGNICFGVEGEAGRLFVKFAGAPTAAYEGRPEDAVARLQAAVPLYRALAHPALTPLIEATAVGGGYAAVFAWAEGICMGRMYPEEHRRVMGLPQEKKRKIFDQIADFLEHTARCGYAAVDFYDGSVMVEPESGCVTICDIDFFRKAPFRNDMGQMWGSSRFMAPEEYALGARIDEATNVFTLGQMAFSLFTDSDRSRAAWPLNGASYRVLQRAIRPEREVRFPTIRAFREAWADSLEA